jgi:hypothetical protein
MKFKLVAYHEYYVDPIPGARRIGIDGWKMYSVIVGYFAKKDEINEAKEKYLKDNLQKFTDKYSKYSKKYQPKITFELQHPLSSFSKEQIEDIENWLGRECIKEEEME